MNVRIFVKHFRIPNVQRTKGQAGARDPVGKKRDLLEAKAILGGRQAHTCQRHISGSKFMPWPFEQLC